MQAETLNCPNCGAAISSDAPRCQYCTSLLATISCPACFALMFKGSKHCPRCGTAAASVTLADLPLRRCPRCHLEMTGILIGSNAVHECASCSGLWLDVASFERICANREQQAAVLGGASPVPGHPAADAVSKISYVPCPECSKLMNRINFARCSGVIVDVCKGHGTWFDCDELSRIVEFIGAGGLEAARNKERSQLAEERRQLRAAQLAADSHDRAGLGLDEDDHRISAIASAGGLLRILLG